jgi:hypothetical protein
MAFGSYGPTASENLVVDRTDLTAFEGSPLQFGWMASVPSDERGSIWVELPKSQCADRKLRDRSIIAIVFVYFDCT